MGLFQLKGIQIYPAEGVESQASFRFIKTRVETHLKSFIDQPLWKWSISEVISKVRQEKWVQDVYVSRALPNKLKIWIRPQNIACLALAEDGKVLPVALDGSFLPEVKAGEIPDLPFLVGHRLVKDKKLRIKALEFFESLPKEGFFSRSTVGELTYNKNGFVARMVDGGLKVILGPSSSANRVEKKISRVNQVLNYIQAKNVKAQTIDSRLSKKVLVKLHKGP